MEWVAWYTEDRVFKSSEIEWKDLPASGVLVVHSLYWENGQRYRTIYDGCDWYALHDGKFVCVPSKEWGDKWEPKPEGVCAGCIKQGVAVSDEEYRRIVQLAWETT